MTAMVTSAQGSRFRWFAALARIVSRVAVVTGALCAAGLTLAQSNASQWPSAGQNPQNTRFQALEQKINTTNVQGMHVKWVFNTEGDVSATPAVDGANVYFPDWAGNLYAVDRRTGQQVWKVRIADASGVPQDKARATPVVAGGSVFVGTQGPFGYGGKMIAYDKSTGAVLWVTTLESHPAAIVTQSATVVGGRLYVGAASQEEAYAGLVPGYPCCSFRGSMSAIDVKTGQILWKTYTVPTGYSGGAIWGSSPAVDVRRGLVYVATGNNYSIPSGALSCVAAAGGDSAAQQACIASDDFFDAVVALDLNTGAVRWVTRALPFDAWTTSCLPFFGDGSNCPQPAGPDYDFGQAPALFSVSSPGAGSRDVVGAGQKSGKYWALDADTGQTIWVTQAGPGGTAGGLQWGSAVDGRRVYTANANYDRKAWTLPNGAVTTDGVWSGLDAATGALLWQTVPTNGGSTSGPVTTANGVVFGCALDSAGYMYALDAATGTILWTYPSGGSCLSGAAISNGNVFWGSGYSNFGFGTPNNKLYAFGVD